MSMKVTMAEFVGLEPCPFCGCEVKMRMHSYLGEWYTIRGEHTPSCPMRKVWRNYADEAEAIEAWNTRAERTCEIEVRDSALGGFTRHCSNCGADLDCDTRNKQNYCPNCGAKVIN